MQWEDDLALRFDTARPCDRELVVERVAILYRQGRPTLYASVLTAVLVAMALWGATPRGALLAWLGASVLISAMRVRLVRSFARSNPHRHSATEAERWEQRYALGAMLGGTSWGALAGLFDTTWPAHLQLLVPLVLAGVTTASLPGNSSSRAALFGFLLPATVPLAVRLFATGRAEFVIIGCMVAVFVGLMAALAHTINARLIEALHLDHHNRRLLARLREKNDRLVQEFRHRSRLEAQHEHDTQLMRGAFEQAGVAMAFIGADGRIMDANRATCEFVGYAREELIGRPVIELTHPADRDASASHYRRMREGELTHYTLRKRYLHRNGSVIWARLTLSAIHDAQGRFAYAIGQAQDVSETWRLQRHIEHQARHDALTGLVNRSELERRLEELLSATDRDRTHTFCYIDLDQFKVVNDSCGHFAGDALLRQVAGRLREQVGASDLLARLGGDEFALLYHGESLEAALPRVERLLGSLRELRFHWARQTFSIAASVGVVRIDETGPANREDLLRWADSACFAAKEAGRNRFHVYHPADERLQRRAREMRWVSEINQALAEHRFLLYRQGIHALSTPGPEVAHFEALLRLRRPGGEIVAPGSFMPAAERYNLAPALDLWVVERVMDWLQSGAGATEATLCSVNLSGASLGDRGFLAAVAGRIERTPSLATRLCFEITETAAIENLAAAIAFMQRMKRVGCRFALDDFGSGLSSFGYLKQLPVDFLKIDGTFVRDIVSDPMQMAMVRSINDIGHVAGMRTVAEFVESAAIARHLHRLGVDLAQGYALDRPRPWLGPDPRG